MPCADFLETRNCLAEFMRIYYSEFQLKRKIKVENTDKISCN